MGVLSELVKLSEVSRPLSGIMVPCALDVHGRWVDFPIGVEVPYCGADSVRVEGMFASVVSGGIAIVVCCSGIHGNHSCTLYFGG